MKLCKGSQRGFTLIELLITLVILAILAAIAYPLYTGYIRGAKRTEAKTNLQSLRLLLEQYYAENSKYCPAAACNNGTSAYTYKENADGSISEQTIITNYLTGFKPKAAASSAAVLYNYAITFPSAGQYLITATYVSGRGAPSGNLTINQDGSKTGW